MADAQVERVDAVVVVRHTGQGDLQWRPERDRWCHDLIGEATERLMAGARAAGLDVADEAALLALGDADFVRAIWASADETRGARAIASMRRKGPIHSPLTCVSIA